MFSGRLPARPLAFLVGAAVAVLVSGADSWLLVRDERASQLREAERALSAQAELLAERLAVGVGSWRYLLGAVGALQALRPGAENALSRQAALTDLVRATPGLLWLGLFDAEGRLLTGSDPGAMPLAGLPAALARGGHSGPADPVVSPDGLTLDVAVAQEGGTVLAGRISLAWAESLRQALEARSPGDVRLSVHDPYGALLLPRGVPTPALEMPVLDISAPIGSSRLTTRASLSVPAELAPLRALAWRLGAGVLAVALAVGGLAAALTHLALRALAESRSRAERDPLTGLRNRAGLAVWEASARGERVALVALDLDGFKPINDAHGHAVGDEVLRGVANAMQARLRPGDAAVRLGGDEFLFALLPRAGEDGAASAEAVAWRLIRVLAEGIETSAGTLPVGASAGVALVPEDATSFSAARALADEALYAAKRAGKRTVRRASPAARAES